MGEASIRVVCSWCESDHVSRDAWADWDVARQVWVLGAVFDDGYYHRCGCERELEERPLDASIPA